MRIKGFRIECLVVFACFLVTFSGHAVIIVASTDGDWPDTWPEALESLREQSETTYNDGMEDIHELRFKNREEFEAAWPHVLSLAVPGSTLRLRSISTAEDTAGGTESLPVIRINAPPKGGVVDIGGEARKEINRLVEVSRNAPREERARLEKETLEFAAGLHQKAGRLLPGPPWPAEVLRPDGSIPEYVTTDEVDGKLVWAPVEFQSYNRYRARTDFELVVDGSVIDLNRISLPPDTRIIDDRTVPAHAADAAQISHLEETK